LCINTCDLHFNKSVFNWTFCQLLMEKPNCTKVSLAGKKFYGICP
jgi:hypothetical protein